MDTLIGTFNLSENQIKNLGVLVVPPFKGGSYNHSSKEYVAVSESQPTQDQIDALISSIEALPEELDQKVLENAFRVSTMLSDMAQAFTGIEAVGLSPYLSAIQNYAEFRNFTGIKEFIDGLVALGKATQAQKDVLYGIFNNQGIDLANY